MSAIVFLKFKLQRLLLKPLQKVLLKLRQKCSLVKENILFPHNTKMF